MFHLSTSLSWRQRRRKKPRRTSPPAADKTKEAEETSPPTAEKTEEAEETSPPTAEKTKEAEETSPPSSEEKKAEGSSPPPPPEEGRGEVTHRLGGQSTSAALPPTVQPSSPAGQEEERKRTAEPAFTSPDEGDILEFTSATEGEAESSSAWELAPEKRWHGR